MGHDCSSARSRKWSSASGFASASRFLTSRPCTTSRTASSTILPLFVRGMSATCTIRAGTCRGVALARIGVRIRPSRSRLSSEQPVAQPDEQHDALVAVPLLADDQALDDLGELLDLAVDLGRADAHAAGIQHGVGAAVDDDAARAR